MIFVLPAVLFWGLFALAIWFFFFRTAVKQEKTVADAQKRDARFEELLQTPNEPLHCLCCQVSFPGPLPENGCPKCSTRAFVIPVQTSTDPVVQSAPLLADPLSVVPHESTEADAAPVLRNHV